MRNRHGGYWIASDDPRAARHSPIGRYSLASPAGADRVALVSKGIERAVTYLNLYSSSRELLDSLFDPGLHSTIADIRDAEEADPNASRHPRTAPATTLPPSPASSPLPQQSTTTADLRPSTTDFTRAHRPVCGPFRSPPLHRPAVADVAASVAQELGMSSRRSVRPACLRRSGLARWSDVTVTFHVLAIDSKVSPAIGSYQSIPSTRRSMPVRSNAATGSTLGSISNRWPSSFQM